MIVRISAGTWEMTESDKRKVQETGILDGTAIDLSQLLWAEVEPNIWQCWFRLR